MMNESSIRTALKRKVLPHYVKHPNSAAVDEVGMLGGNSRIDILVINSILHGFEIKSDQDTLIRLPEQISTYCRVLDKVTLVVGYNNAYKALRIIPNWWGVKLAYQGSRGAIHFEDARFAQKNPSQDPYSLALLLWHEEALELLDSLEGKKGYKSKTTTEICHRVAEISDLPTIRNFVIQRLYARLISRSDPRLGLNGGSHQSGSKS